MPAPLCAYCEGEATLAEEWPRLASLHGNVTADLPESTSALHLAGVKHPNRIPFEGVLTRLDQPSDSAPNGARGHRVLLTTDAAEAALPTLIGMAVGFVAELDGHNARQKCGVITAAEIEGDELRVRGHIYGRDFPEVVPSMQRPDVALGMSFEMCDAHVEDMRASVWRLTEVTFTGAAILLRHKAAYKTTRFALQACGERFTGTLAVEGTVSLLAEAVLR